jgi:hypothetical protein
MPQRGGNYMTNFLLLVIAILLGLLFITVKSIHDNQLRNLVAYNPDCPAYPYKQLAKIFMDIEKNTDVDSPIRSPKIEIFKNLQELNIKVVNGELSIKDSWAAHDEWIGEKFTEWREKIPNYDDKAFNQLLSWKEDMGNW